MAFICRLTNFDTLSPQLATFEETEAWVRKAGFEASIWDLSVQINFGYQLVATYSPISGLRDLRPFAGKPDPYYTQRRTEL